MSFAPKNYLYNLNNVLFNSGYCKFIFARRGAIDINPIRATDISLLPKSLIDPGQYSPRTPMQ